MDSDPHESDWKKRVEEAASNPDIAKELALQLLADRSAAEGGGRPSSLCLFAPSYKSETAQSMARIMFPNLPQSVSKEAYKGLLQNLKLSLSHVPQLPKPQATPSNSPSEAAYLTTLQVLQYLSVNDRPQGPYVDAIFAAATAISGRQPSKNRKKGCYICRLPIHAPHPSYPQSLCMSCGILSLQERDVPFPSLTGRTALVTGGRVNLGREISLRLLRAGCTVFISTRFPFDAENSFIAEKDSKDWVKELRIIRADFTSSQDVCELVAALVKECTHLDILVNNAAQTVALSDAEMTRRKTWDQYYLEEGSKGREGSNLVVAPRSASTTTTAVDIENTGTVAIPAFKNSWLQEIQEIPYQELLDVLTINSLVPFILVKELLPILRRSRRSSEPFSHIINVSSREGIFETHNRKTGHHVHTNMSKAAFNMITETCAGKYYEEGILMNTVDPGFMSMDVDEIKQKKTWKGCPIGWEDGAARVLYPIREAEEGRPVWGKFFKHFREFEWSWENES